MKLAGCLTRTPFVLAVVCAAAALGACGGSSSHKASGTKKTTTSRPSTTTTTTSRTSTTTTKRPVTSNNDPLGVRTAIKPADLGPGFTQYSKADGWSAVGAKSCSVAGSSPVTPADHVYSGPKAKDRAGRVFVYSVSYVFKAPSSATSYAEYRSTAAFRSCKRQQDQTAERTRNKKLSVRSTDAKFADPARHVTTFYREIASVPAKDGSPVDTATYDRFTFQHGRVVVVINIDSGIVTAAEVQSLNDEVVAAYNAAVRALVARVPAA